MHIMRSNTLALRQKVSVSETTYRKRFTGLRADLAARIPPTQQGQLGHTPGSLSNYKAANRGGAMGVGWLSDDGCRQRFDGGLPGDSGSLRADMARNVTFV